MVCADGSNLYVGIFPFVRFSLYLSYQHKNLYKIKENKSYILKRIIGIVPLYYVVSVLYVIFLGKETTFQNILLAPIEMMGLQSMFSLFSVSHNSGTWFISCILICYFVYPLLQEISKQIRFKSKIIILGLIVFVLVWSPFVVIHFGLVSIYYNPFFRLIEFFAGVLLSSVMPHIRNSKISRIVFSWWVLTLEFMFMFIAVTVAVKKKIICW
ncbi:MAG: hypothetical protein E7279_03750 [Lachnospiraceae bacterium]|nr:hypothetical protein [Lachnospiraceae bacterium]